MIRVIMIDDENSSFHSFLDKMINVNDVEYHFLKDNVNEVTSYLKENDVDAVFLDINMPNINGIELAKYIIKEKSDIKIIFVTGLDKTLNDLPSNIKKNTLGIIYKPVNEIDLNYYLNTISESSSKIKASLFGNFDCFVNNKLIEFSSKKSKELFALLIVYNGKSVSMDLAICNLWPDKDIDKAKILYRDAVWRLRQVLESIKIPCVNFSRANLSLDTSKIECDYYDYLKGKYKGAVDSFLIEYEWSLEYQFEMSNKKKK